VLEVSPLSAVYPEDLVGQALPGVVAPGTRLVV